MPPDSDTDAIARARLLRTQRVIANDLENIPFALVIFWLAAALSADDAQEQVANAFVHYVAARTAYSAVYLAGVGFGIRTAFFTY